MVQALILPRGEYCRKQRENLCSHLIASEEGDCCCQVGDSVQARLKIAFSVISVKVGYTGVKCLMMIVKVWIHLLSIQPTQETVFKLPHVTWLLQL